jgi:hypothetical protein
MGRLFATAILLPCGSCAVAGALSEDSQLWSELDARYPVAAAWSATGILTTRLGNDLPNPTLTAAGLQIDYRFGSWMASATGYYVSISNAQSGARTQIWLPAAALTYGISVGPVALSDRNRLEQLEGIPGSPARYRNRASADWNIPGGRLLSDVFLSDEAFYDFSRDRWSRNRAQLGVEFQLAPDARLQTFYMRQNNSYGVPARLDVLGLTLQLDIRQ